ncbi:transposable element Tcb2 transposase [Trichonephila clavipes]|nr:transposable element Tcb2 transposase [Trichonephila clavipes]
MHAALIMWRQSISDCQMRFVSMLSDGDSKTFQFLSDNKIYGSDIKIEKEECLNHIAKRLDTSLRNKVKEWKVKKVTLGGRKQGSLTDKNITKLQNYYRKAIKDNVPDTDKMKNAIHWCAKIKDEVEKLAYQLNEEAERTERPIRRLSKVMYGSTCADMQVDVMGECLSSIKHVVGEHYPGFSSGRPRVTTPADDWYIVLQARRNRRQTAGEIARHKTQATGRPISRFTVARRLYGGGLFARCPVRCVPLTPAHRRRRSLWCREHRNWRDNEWGRVLFTDESRFSLSSDSHRIFIWREREAAIIPRTSLKGTDSVNGTRYCNEILLPYVRLFRGSMGLQFLFMYDNAPCHRTVAAKQLLESEDIERMDWPARSPDLNPIEHVWDFLGRRLAARTLPPVTIRELRLALQDEWAAMPQQLIDTHILSMGRRCETYLAVREIISPTKDRMFLAGHPSHGCFGLQSHCAPCYFFNKASFCPSDFSFSKCCLHYTCPYVLGILRY